MQDNREEARGMGQRLKKLLYGKWGAVIILICLMIFALFSRSGSGLELDFGDTEMTVSIAGASIFTVAYQEIERIEYVSSPDYGTAVSEAVSQTYSAGTWENSLWGTYQLAVDSSIDCCIAIYASDGVYVLNYQSADTTTSLYSSLLDLVAEKTQ